MSYEKLGAVRKSNKGIYYRKARGINLPTDFMTDKEIEKMSSKVKVYKKEVSK